MVKQWVLFIFLFCVAISLMKISHGVVSLCQNKKRLANKQRQAFKAIPFEFL